MSLKEYLYIDERRLNSYIDQIAGPIKYKKIPTWKASFGLAGPSAGANQIVDSRPYSTNEKIVLLDEYLKKESLVLKISDLYDNNVFNRDSPVMFIHDRFCSTKVIIPSAKSEKSEPQGLTIWIISSKLELETIKTSSNVEQYLLLLLEDPNVPDGIIHYRRITANTILESLLYSIDYPFSTSLVDYDFYSAHSLYPRSYQEDEIDYRVPNKIKKEFIKNPATFLKRLNCYISGPREIISLFRIRDISDEHIDNSPGPASIIGYPIYIYQ